MYIFDGLMYIWVIALLFHLIWSYIYSFSRNMMLDRKSSAPFDHPLIYRPILKQPATKIMRKRKENECSEAYATQPI